MEIYLFARCRMPGRATSRNDGIQNAAGAVGKGIDPSLQENIAASLCQQRLTRSESRSLVPPDRESQLSTDDRALGSTFAGDDHSVLSGMVPDALYRPAFVHGFDIFHFEFLHGFAKRIVSKN